MNNNSEIEVEVRGPLTQNDYARIKNILSAKGTYKESKRRVLIDYSESLGQDLGNRNKDIRLRMTNGVPEIILKLGQWGKNEGRKEISVKANPGDFNKLMEIFSEIGIDKGVLCFRNSLVYDYNGVEFALVEVPSHSYYFEAEKLIHNPKDKKDAINEINRTCNQLGLNIFSKKEFTEYVTELNNKVNEQFQFSTSSKEELDKICSY